MDTSLNQTLTTLFPILFAAGIIGLFFRILKNRASDDYKRTSDEFEKLSDEIAKSPLLDRARLYQGELRGEDVAALIVSWANQGYVQLRFKSKSGGQSEISLKKLKDLTDNSAESERAIFECFFNKTEGRAIPKLKLDLKFDPAKIDPEKLARYEDQSAVTRINAFAGELATRFSNLLEDIRHNQNRYQSEQVSQATHHKLTLLELFMSLSSLFMLAAGFSFFIDGQKFATPEFYAYAGLGLLLVFVYFGALYSLGRKICFANFLGYLGVGFLIYLALTGIQSGYENDKSFYFPGAYRYFGFIFGSILALVTPSARALTTYGRNMRDLFIIRRQTLSQQTQNQQQFWQFLPEFMLYDSAASNAKKFELTPPEWYVGPATNQSGRLDPNLFLRDLEQLRRELHMLAIVKR
jgi:hypothetical protein